MSYFYDPLNRACKSRKGAVARGSAITFRVLKTESNENLPCRFRFRRDGADCVEYEMEAEENGWALTLRLNEVGLYFYDFRIGDRFLGRGDLRRGILTDSPESWQLTVYREDYRTPQWIKGGVMYQIFPDRFYKSGNLPVSEHKILRNDWGGQPRFRKNEFGKVPNNDFFGGNLNGIREKLGYLSSLGVNVVYLNPIFEAHSNHRYDTGDYMKIDGLLGSEADFRALTEDAEKLGIKIVLDGVFNHTGDDSRYFNKYGRYDSIGAYQSKSSPYFEWYRFSQFPDCYESWWGIEILPAVNEHSISYQNFIFGKDGVLKKWLQNGAGGYRLDVADELPDFFLEKLRNSIKEEDPDAVIIGEVWEDASNKIAYDERRKYLQGAELDSVMNYPLKDAVIDYILSGNLKSLRETVAMLLDNYPKQTVDCLMNILGTHDTSRILTVLGGRPCADKEEMSVTMLSPEERAEGKKRLKAAALLQFTLPGIPCIYYGDENGMEGYCDPFCRGCFRWDQRDTELYEFYRVLGEIRRGVFSEVFAEGEYREIFADRKCFVFERYTKSKSVYIYVNRSFDRYDVETVGTYAELLTGNDYTDILPIAANSYGIFTKKK